MRDTPYANSVADGDLEKLGQAFTKRVADSKRGPVESTIDPVANSPQTVRQRAEQGFFDGGTISAAHRTTHPDNYRINYNPNADKAFLAHELGHIASDRTGIGNLIHSARTSPQLTKALKQASIIAPGAAAALTPGDDDLATSLALSYAAAAPTIIDEALATKNGLAMMDSAGMRASLGQRGKLAGALLTYMSAPLLAGVATNYVGNLMDDELVGTNRLTALLCPN